MKKTSRKKKIPAPVIGWREWVSFPELGIDQIKAKVDTGARTSSLHISESEYIKKSKTIHFRVHPKQRSKKPEISATAKVVDQRPVKSSNGKISLRPVIQTLLEIGGVEHTIELTLINRDMMGFRLLLGRQAIRGTYIVDPGKSYLQSKKRSPKK